MPVNKLDCEKNDTRGSRHSRVRFKNIVSLPALACCWLYTPLRSTLRLPEALT